MEKYQSEWTELARPLDFNKVLKRMRAADFIPIYGIFRHFDRYGDDQSIIASNLIDRIDDTIFLGVCNYLILRAGMEIYFRLYI